MAFIILILIQLVVFGALIFVLKSLIQRNLTSASSHLEALTLDSEKRFSESKQKLDEANRYYEETLGKSKAEGDKVRKQMIDEGVKEKQELLDRARKEADAIMERARSARKLLEENWDEELSAKAREITARILQAILPEQMSQTLQAEWIKDVFESELEGLTHLNIPEDISMIRVVSAMPLTVGQKSVLTARLAEKLGRPLKMEESVDEKLILGFCLYIGSVVLDNSLAWKIKEALQNERNKQDQ